MKSIAYITMPSLFFYWLNWDDPEYQEIPRHQRDLFWFVKIPRGWVDFVPDAFRADAFDAGLGRTALDRAILHRIKPIVEGGEDFVWLRLPKPFQLGIIFGTIPERMLDYARSRDPEGLKQTLTRLFGVDPTFERKGALRAKDFIRSDVGSIAVPDIQFVMPHLENWANYSRFRDRPIVPRALQDLEPWRQESPYSSEVARWIGWQLNASPAKIDNIIQSWTAGVGNYVIGASEWAGAATGLLPEKDRPTRGVPNWPFVRSFTYGPAGFGSESVQRFYEDWSQARAAYMTDRRNEREGHRMTERHREEAADLIASYQFLESRRQMITNLQAEADVIRHDLSMTPRQRQYAIDQLGKEATQIARMTIGRRVPGMDPAEDEEQDPVVRMLQERQNPP